MEKIETNWGHTLSEDHAARFRKLADQYCQQGPRFVRSVRDGLADVLLSHDDIEAEYWLRAAEQLALMQQRFGVALNTSGAAFRTEDEELETAEVARLLRQAADRVEQGETAGSLIDYNGNNVGSFNGR